MQGGKGGIGVRRTVGGRDERMRRKREERIINR